jgi:hypothetical protein
MRRMRRASSGDVASVMQRKRQCFCTSALAPLKSTRSCSHLPPGRRTTLASVTTRMTSVAASRARWTICIRILALTVLPCTLATTTSMRLRLLTPDGQMGEMAYSWWAVTTSPASRTAPRSRRLFLNESRNGSVSPIFEWATVTVMPASRATWWGLHPHTPAKEKRVRTRETQGAPGADARVNPDKTPLRGVYLLEHADVKHRGAAEQDVPPQVALFQRFVDGGLFDNKTIFRDWDDESRPRRSERLQLWRIKHDDVLLWDGQMTQSILDDHTCGEDPTPPAKKRVRKHEGDTESAGASAPCNPDKTPLRGVCSPYLPWRLPRAPPRRGRARRALRSGGSGSSEQ